MLPTQTSPVRCSSFLDVGTPWYVAATVAAITHINSLKKESEVCAPGEKPTFIGIRHVLIIQR